MSPRIRILAGGAVGTVVFGGTLAALAAAGPFDPRVALAGLMAAGALTLALLVMIWARHRTEAARQAGPAIRSGGADDGPPPKLAVVSLGDGQAAVIWEEAAARAVSPPSAPPVATGADATAASDAIWAAVEAAVGAAATPPRAVPPRTGPFGRVRWPWRTARRRLRPRRSGSADPPASRKPR
jgi:hypothetical protein